MHRSCAVLDYSALLRCSFGTLFHMPLPSSHHMVRDLTRRDCACRTIPLLSEFVDLVRQLGVVRKLRPSRVFVDHFLRDELVTLNRRNPLFHALIDFLAHEVADELLPVLLGRGEVCILVYRRLYGLLRLSSLLLSQGKLKSIRASPLGL